MPRVVPWGSSQARQNALTVSDRLISWTTDTYAAVYPTRFLVQGMVLFKESLSQWAPEKRDGSDNPNSTLLFLETTDAI